jgi:hypothetical protein
MRFLGNPPEVVRKGLEHVFERAVASGLSAPSAVAVDDVEDRWLAAVSGFSPDERRGVVLVASRDESLASAARLGVGGAVWQPCSSIAALEALEAAAVAAARDDPAPDSSVAALADEPIDHTELSIADHRFWLDQVGRCELERSLLDLADALDRPPVVLERPSLWIAGKLDLETVAEAWRGLHEANDAPAPDLIRSEVSRDGSRGTASGVEGVRGPFPVRELPSGRQVGRWSLEPEPGSEPEWVAWPEDAEKGESVWTLRGPGLQGKVIGVRTTEALESASDCAAVRAPGWLGEDLRPGSPAGVLVSRLAESAHRRELPLWIPNLGSDGLHLVLSFPGTLWVDGPAVPG